MTPRLRRFALTIHVTCSVGSLGAVASFLVLAIVGLTSSESSLVQAVYRAMELIARFAVVPTVLASLATGIIQSLGTAWGLFRHYWVLVKLLLNVFVAIVLLLKMKLIRYAAQAATQMALSSG